MSVYQIKVAPERFGIRGSIRGDNVVIEYGRDGEKREIVSVWVGAWDVLPIMDSRELASAEDQIRNEEMEE